MFGKLSLDVYLGISLSKFYQKEKDDQLDKIICKTFYLAQYSLGIPLDSAEVSGNWKYMDENLDKS